MFRWIREGQSGKRMMPFAAGFGLGALASVLGLAWVVLNTGDERILVIIPEDDPSVYPVMVGTLGRNRNLNHPAAARNSTILTFRSNSKDDRYVFERRVDSATREELQGLFQEQRSRLLKETHPVAQKFWEWVDQAKDSPPE
jgi:hypothetical protein